ncbi:MAG TPA: TMEM175 family protein [Bradyrhizobium sp.]
MTDGATPTERLTAFSDAVFAVIITIMVLDLKPPAQAKLSALLPLWPSALSYAVSYLFVAIIWINHHRLLLFAHDATPKLMWWNFAHLFMTSLIPFSTAWIADTRLAAGPVLFYAAVFVMVNIAFLGYQQEALSQASESEVSPATRRLTRVRALITLGVFAAATCVAYWHPLPGFGLVCCVLLIYLRPQVPGEGLEPNAGKGHLKSIRLPDHPKKETL